MYILTKDKFTARQIILSGGFSLDTNLIIALKSSDGESALSRIVSQFSAYVRTVLRNFSNGSLNADDLDELCSDVFFNLWLHRADLNENVGLKPYLSISAKNAVKNRLRAKKPPTEDVDELDFPSDLSIEKTAELNDMMRQLQIAFQTLSDSERELFLRYFFYGEKTADIARVMGLNENTARSKLSRVRGKLKDFLIKRGYDHV